MRGLAGKVALVTGAARGQGRAHALRLASEGVDLVVVDRCAQIDTVPYPLATPEDLDETVRLVEAYGRRALGRHVDVRDAGGLAAAMADSVSDLGRLDIVIANAGIFPVGGASGASQADIWRDVIDVNLTGAWNTARAAIPALVEGERGGSIVLVSSTAGLHGFGSWADGGGPAYSASKHGLVGIMRSLARELARHDIRVNTVHPTGVATPMIRNQAMAAFLAAEDPSARPAGNAMPVGSIEPEDVSDAVAWLVSDQARYVTGTTLPVDAGYLLR